MKQIACVLVIVFSMMLMLAGSVLAWSSTTFNNSLGIENLTFTGNQNITRYLAVPITVTNLLTGQLNLSGFDASVVPSPPVECYQNLANVSTACGGLDSGTYSASGSPWTTLRNMYDGDWATQGYASGGIPLDLYINYTLPTASLTTAVKWEIKGESGQFSNFTLPGNCFSGSVLQFKLTSDSVPATLNGSCWNTTGWNNVFNYGSGNGMYESAVIWNLSSQLYPKNPSLTIGTTNVWNYSGFFSQTNNRTKSLASVINNYLLPAYLVGSNYLIPFVFHSDTEGILQYSNLYFDNLGITENSQTYNNLTYETSIENFNINLTYDYLESSLTCSLVYNGTSYAGTKSGTGTNILCSKALSIPSSLVSNNNSFYWSVVLTNLLSTTYINSTINNQTVKPIILGRCNSTNTVSYVNFTFKDETTEAYMNATLDLSTWQYWLGDGSVTKSLVYTNTSVNNPSYGFCFIPSDRILHRTLTQQYSYTGYPTRVYSSVLDLTNATSNVPLYLLSTGSGLDITYQVIRTSDASVIPGVFVTAERQFGGTWTIVTQGITGADGVVTFYLNPNFDHRITATLAGCTVQQFTHQPTSTTYTITMPCNGTSSSGGFTVVTPDLEGITYQKAPASGIVGGGLTNFSYFVNWSNGVLTGAKFELVSRNGTVVASNTTIASCSGCYLSLSYNVTDDLKGRYYVNEGSGWMMIEGDARWRFIVSNVSSTGTLRNFFNGLYSSFNIWGESSICSTNYKTKTTCETASIPCKWVGNRDCNAYSSQATCTASTNNGECSWDAPTLKCVFPETPGICIPTDRINKIEYSRIVWFFLVMAILLTLLSKFTGYDAMNPGFFMLLMCGLVIMLSISGGVTGEGYFYLDGLTGIHFINNYIFAATCLIFSLGVMANTWRRVG